MTSGHAVAIDLTVVIPTVGRQLVHDCLESIAAGDMWPRDLIVVDQGRSLAVASDIARLRRLGLNACHLPSSEIGIASATNRGIARSATVYVAVTHDDCRVAPDWIRRMANRLPQIGEALLSGRVEPSGEGANPTIVTSLVPRVYDVPLPDRDVLFPANMGFPRGIVDRIGMLDEHPSLRFAGEDNEWAYRALRAGVPIVYEPDVVVYHVAWRPTRELATILARYARGQGAFYAKYLLQGDTFIAQRAVHDLARGPWLLVRGLATRNRSLAAWGRGELRGLLPGLLAGFRGRRFGRS